MHLFLTQFVPLALLLAFFQLAVVTSHNPNSDRSPKWEIDTSMIDLTAPIPLPRLATVFSNTRVHKPQPPSNYRAPFAPTNAPNPLSAPSNLTSSQISTTQSAIRNTLSLYPLAIDGKNFSALSAIFSPSATANYSSPLNILSPLSDIQSTLSKSLECVSTQHSLGTQVVEILSERYARSVTYYTAVHFGTTEKMKREVATAHGQYQDLWEVDGEGEWRVVYRNLVYMSEVLGNQGVFVC